MVINAQSTSTLEVQGHRGARSVLPENSLPAFEYALKLGVDTLELDTGVSADGHVVVTHDQKINKTICQYLDGTPIGDDELWVHRLTLDQIKQFDCGRLVNPRFTSQTLIPGTQIPTLREVFELVNASLLPHSKSVLFNIETKSKEKYPHAQPDPETFASLILNLAAEYSLTDRITIQSFDHRTLIASKKLAPAVTTAALFEENLSDWVTPTLAAKADIVSPYHKNLKRKEIERIHAAGLKVIPWTANKKEEWQRLIDLGVDGIITDDPKPLLEFLGRLN